MLSDKQERIMWRAICAAIVMLLFPPYFNHFAEDPHSYPDAGSLHVYGWFLSPPRNADGVDIALQMAQLGILGLLTVGYLLSLGKHERELAEYERKVAEYEKMTATEKPDTPAA